SPFSWVGSSPTIWFSSGAPAQPVARTARPKTRARAKVVWVGFTGGLLHAWVGGWSRVRPAVRRPAGAVGRVDRNQHVTPDVKTPRSDLTTRIIKQLSSSISRT